MVVLVNGGATEVVEFESQFFLIYILRYTVSLKCEKAKFLI